MSLRAVSRTVLFGVASLVVSLGFASLTVSLGFASLTVSLGVADRVVVVSCARKLAARMKAVVTARLRKIIRENLSRGHNVVIGCHRPVSSPHCHRAGRFLDWRDIDASLAIPIPRSHIPTQIEAVTRAGPILCALASFVLLPPSASAQEPLPLRPSLDTIATSNPQSVRTARLIIVNGDSVERWGDDQRLGLSPTTGYLLRSASTLTAKSARSQLRAIPAEFHAVYNSQIPFSMNEGGAWAGRGAAWLVTAGFDAHLWKTRFLFAPQLALSANGYWLVRDSTHFPPPALPPDRNGNGYMFPWYGAPYSIDLPLRYGDSRLSRFSFGQSSVSVEAKALAVGFSTENEWWGPGVRNAIILSNNAPGFPHLFLRSARPLDTPFGLVEFRWLSGALYESKWFDADPTNNLRSIAAIGTTVTPHRVPGLTFGFARSVYSTARRSTPTFFRFFEVFKDTGYPNDRPLGDSTLTPGGSDQVYSLFARWVMPESGIETYAELGRTEFPRSVRDFLVYPTHTVGYTLGLQWNKLGAHSRFQAEVTNLEQGSSFRDRPIGSWYTSRRVIQGYTNQGQSLGAAIGPGSSSQYIGWDYRPPLWSAGVYAGRIRWNEDMRSVYNWPEYLEYCNHDVSYFIGARGGARTRLGLLSADLAVARRINAFFQLQSGCGDPVSVKDYRNKTLSITFAPFAR